ncbi:hypothetical protein KSP35_15335 [Aquihabitans sp. G128]|uniref:hypothetical protein n=1 Tax=Aquihabitans sp. G128 TaxID=2849779 RepID=UPI001C2478F2|nr:hypothetical protein [Aquihabitans sp. G128]QXC59745.1 hypothetical protein KSP35_15335 [Aquihabitans sp. G128]
MARPLDRRRPPWTHLAVLAVVAGAMAACGGTSEEGSKAAPKTTADPTTTTRPTDEARPEGRWTFVLTTTARSDVSDLDPGVAVVRLATLTPSCDEGPCDVDVAPAGAKGTYLPEGVAFRDTPNSDPATYRWDGSAKTYTRVSGPRTSSCTNVDGKVVADAYTDTTTTTMEFHPPEADRPATMTGTYVEKVEATEAGLKEGCTAYEETGTAVATPTGSLTEGAGLDLHGAYIGTEVVTKIDADGAQPPGFIGLLGRFELTRSGKGYDAKGIIGTAALAPDGTGFTGRTASVERPCTTTPETPKAYASVEELADLEPVALTEDGDPILAGRWTLSEEATPVGTAAGCASSTNTGYLVLVPAASLD